MQGNKTWRDSGAAKALDDGGRGAVAIRRRFVSQRFKSSGKATPLRATPSITPPHPRPDVLGPDLAGTWHSCAKPDKRCLIACAGANPALQCIAAAVGDQSTEIHGQAVGTLDVSLGDWRERPRAVATSRQARDRMMNINGISGNIYPLSPLPPGYNTSPGSTAYASSPIGSKNNSGQVGTLVSAIFQALSQSGISGTSSASSSGSRSTVASSSNPLQALGSFMQTLISALQNQSSPGGQAAPPPPVNSAAAAATSSNEASSRAASAAASAPSSNGSGTVARTSTLYHLGRRGGHDGGASRIESNLQGLIQQLSSGSSSTSPSIATAAFNSTSSLDSLQQSFQDLTNSLGNTSGSASASLGNFLQAFSQNLEKLGSTGNILNTQA